MDHATTPAELIARAAQDAEKQAEQQEIEAAKQSRRERFRSAWDDVRYFTQDMAGHISREQFYEAWGDRIISLGSVLKELGWDRHLDSIGDGSDSLKYAIEIFRSAIRGDEANVAKLILDAAEVEGFCGAVNEALRTSIMQRVWEAQWPAQIREVHTESVFDWPEAVATENKKKQTVVERMAAIYKNDRRCVDWTAEEWAKLLNCSVSAIKKPGNYVWKAIKKDRQARMDALKKGGYLG